MFQVFNLSILSYNSMYLIIVFSEHNDAEPFDLSYFKGCLLDTDVQLDAVEVLSPVKASPYQDEKQLVNFKILMVGK